MTEIGIQVFIAFLSLHNLEPHDYPAKRVVLLSLNADIVCRKINTAILLQDYLGGLKKRRHLPQRAIVSFGLNIEQRVFSGGVFVHADSEHQLVVIHLLRDVVKITVV